MVTCVALDQNGYVFVMNPQPIDISECHHVLTTVAELSPFALDIKQAVAISGSIAVLWALGFVCRSFIRQIIYSR